MGDGDGTKVSTPRRSIRKYLVHALSSAPPIPQTEKGGYVTSGNASRNPGVRPQFFFKTPILLHMRDDGQLVSYLPEFHP